jgi:hypothetical protein
VVGFRLQAAGVEVEVRDLTRPENAESADRLRALGFSSAPVTEFGERLVAGFVPSELDVLIAEWRADRTAPGARTPEAVDDSVKTEGSPARRAHGAEYPTTMVGG